jgi:hypothetical protein
VFSQGNIQAKALFIIVILSFEGLAAFVDFPNLTSNATSDQVVVVSHINSHITKTDMVAANLIVLHCFLAKALFCASYSLHK